MSVEHLEDLLQSSLGTDISLVSSEISNLVAPGENYGGELLKIDITIEDKTTKNQRVIHGVAKKIPQNEGVQEFFNIQKTFKGEIDFYAKIIPALQNFQKSHGLEKVINCFADLYGSRINLDGSERVDSNAVIMLENLHVSGFKNIDRHVGYNLHEAELVLKNLAMLHAVPLAMKRNNPELFNTEIRPKLNNSLPVHMMKRHPFLEAWYLLEEVLYESDKCLPAIPHVKRAWQKFKEQETYVAREPFATFYHGDLWANNIMMKFVNGQAVESKLVDFQLYDYRSPVLDLLYFLFSSLQTNVLKDDFDHLVKFYHNNLIDNLKKLKCDIQPFRYTEFLKEFQEDAYSVLVWSTFFIPGIVCLPKGGIADPIKHLVGVDFSIPKNRDFLRQTIHPAAKEKVQIIVQICARNKWL